MAEQATLLLLGDAIDAAAAEDGAGASATGAQGGAARAGARAAGTAAGAGAAAGVAGTGDAAADGTATGAQDSAPSSSAASALAGAQEAATGAASVAASSSGSSSASSSTATPASASSTAAATTTSAADGSDSGVDARDDYDSGGSYTGIDDVDSGLESARDALDLLDTRRYVGDPPTTALFRVFIGGLPGFAFLSCEGLGISNSVSEHYEGGLNHHPWQFAGTTSYDPIVLRRGYMLDLSAVAIAAWRSSVMTWGSPLRVSGLILLEDADETPLGAWYFSRGIIKRWSAPHLTAGGTDIAIEELEIAHEGLTVMDVGLQLIAAAPELWAELGDDAASIPSAVLAGLA